MDYHQVEQEILKRRGDTAFMQSVIADANKLKEKYDWQTSKFLNSYPDVLNLDTSNPFYRYYNFKCDQYAQVERIIRVAKAFQ